MARPVAYHEFIIDQFLGVLKRKTNKIKKIYMINASLGPRGTKALGPRESLSLPEHFQEFGDKSRTVRLKRRAIALPIIFSIHSSSF